MFFFDPPSLEAMADRQDEPAVAELWRGKQDLQDGRSRIQQSPDREGVGFLVESATP
jgi:hypothetical protein